MGAVRRVKVLWDKGLDSRVFRYLLAPLLVVIAGGVVVHVLTGLAESSKKGPPKVRIDTAASLVHPTDGTDSAAEYVCLVSEEGRAVSLTGWKLADAEGFVNVLPQFLLEPHAKVRVHPGGGDEHADTTHDLYGGQGSSWNDGGDTVTLLNSNYTKIDSQSYSARDPGEVRGACESNP